MTRPATTLLSALLVVMASDLNVQAQVAEQDSLALVALYNATDGDNWIDNTNWLTGPFSTWFGVTVSRNRVTSLRLGDNQLSGPVSEALGNLAVLTELIINNNPLRGTLPLSLTKLTDLDTFYFDNTDLCEPIDTTFQAWLQDIPDVRGTGITCMATASEDLSEFPARYVLAQNCPNPFNPGTTIPFSLSRPSHVQLRVYDLLGRAVATLVSTTVPAGQHTASWEAGGLPSGVYVYRLEAEGFSEMRKLVLRK